jgi:23S rRNA (cytosine1962-C5)-methyltransferase
MSHPRTYTTSWEDYELIDAGGGKKLERWGKIITIRPELQAYFQSVQPFTEWRKKAHWEFVETNGTKGKWKALQPNTPSNWQIKYEKLLFKLELTAFKHVGIFPEQRCNWDWVKDSLQSEEKILNLFAYTGAMSCIARWKGAETTHVDAVKPILSWARENMESSRLLNIRWVHEDALKFAQREEKRGNQYDVIVMDPPAWGIGAKGEKWKLEDNVDQLMSTAAAILSPKGRLVMNTYSPMVTFELLEELAACYFPERNCDLSELYMESTTEKHVYFGNLLRIQPNK